MTTARTARSLKRIRSAAVVAALCAAGGCGRQVVGVAKPDTLLAWAPQPSDPSARITTVKTTATRTYVGFSNGERLFKQNAEVSWTRFDKGPPGGCSQPMPKGPITAFAVTEATVFASFAGVPGSPGLWRSPEDRSCWGQITIGDDLWSLSVSPFADFELVAVGASRAWVSHDLGGAWDYGGQPTSFRFDGDVQAMATGVSPTGAPRAWLGDATGHIYYSDDLANGTTGDQVHWTPVAPAPGFPGRRVVAISIDVGRPQTIWITFAGLHTDSLWTSDDGLSWRNPHGGDLATFVDATHDAGADADAPLSSTFIGVSPVPAIGVAFLTALVPDGYGKLSVTSFWSTDGSDDWWRL